ncbi:platelet-activating factor acetylhydrolase [Chytriomyces sp. MP71]|nr:platelet-activating factor acetylhydrolase [Chytriomyces sp. MP71]
MPLLSYPGSYAVGTVPIETAPATPHSHGVLASIFYPTDADARQPQSTWLLGPRKFYSTGFGDYVNLSRWISAGPMAWLLDSFRMPARAGAALLQVKMDEENGDARRYPVAVFCHGLAGNQTTYSTFCGTLASRGFVVVSIGHRDGSGSVAARNNYKERIPCKLNGLYCRCANRLRMVTLLADKRQPSDQDEYTFRNDQLMQRAREVEEAMQLLRDLDRGTVITNLLSNNLPDFKRRLDLQSAVIMGHSFGGVTALYALQLPGTPFIAGVILDPWMMALPTYSAITVPILSIQSEVFHWPANVQQMQKLFNQPSANILNQFSVVKGTKHQDISDVPSLVFGILKLVRQQGAVAPKVVHSTYDSLVTGFLQKVYKGRYANYLQDTVVANVDTSVAVHGPAAYGLLPK